jgi:anion-transporting  ArsA/GET3 family ATPase
VEPEQFFAASSVLIVAGKGGVGKTTVTAALGLAASRSGLRTLIVELEGKGGIEAIFGRGELSFDELVLVEPGDGHAGLTARTVTPDDALLAYLRDHGLKRISNRLVASGALELVATAVPGIRDILVLGGVKSVERSGAFDLVLVDAPAAGHAITFLTSAAGLADAVTVGPIATQANEVQELLTDPSRCRVVLVTTPEETPVNELIETAFSLEDEVGVALGPVVVNRVHPELPGLEEPPERAAAAAGVELDGASLRSLADAAELRRARTALQRAQLERMANELPLPQVRLPFRFTTELTRADLDALADALLAHVDALAGPEAGA